MTFDALIVFSTLSYIPLYNGDFKILIRYTNSKLAMGEVKLGSEPGKMMRTLHDIIRGLFHASVTFGWENPEVQRATVSEAWKRILILIFW